MENAKCILVRGDIEIWVSESEANKTSQLVQDGMKFVYVRGRLINTMNIVGIFTPEDMEEKGLKHRGMWKADNGQWFSKDERSESWRKPFVVKKIEAAGGIKQIEA